LQVLSALKRSRFERPNHLGEKGSSEAVLLLALATGSFLAALAVFSSPWHVSPPLSVPLSLWIRYLLPLLSSASLTFTRRVASSSIILPILVSAVYAIPLAGLSFLCDGGSARIKRVGLVAGILVLVGTLLHLPAAGGGVGCTAWAAGLCALGTVALGVALLLLGRREAVAWAVHGWVGEVLGWLLTFAGIAITTLVLLPLGLVLLGGAYVALGTCYVRRFGHMVSREKDTSP